MNGPHDRLAPLDPTPLDLAPFADHLRELLVTVQDDVDRAALAAGQIIGVLQGIAQAQLRLLRALEEEQRFGPFEPPAASPYASS